jgi:hypothetical protein
MERVPDDLETDPFDPRGDEPDGPELDEDFDLDDDEDEDDDDDDDNDYEDDDDDFDDF